MFLFPIVKKSRQLIIKLLSGTGVTLLLLSLFFQITSGFNGLDWLTDYLFLSGLIFLAAAILIRIVFKTTVDAGFIGFHGLDFFIKARDKSFHLDIANEKIEQIVFKPGKSSDSYPLASLFLGAIGLFFGSNEGTDSLLMLKSSYGISNFHMKFETDRQMEIFEDVLRKHPKAVILKK